MKKILVLFAHPSLHRSEVNLPLFKAAKKIDHVEVVDLYGEYPTYHIDIDKEQRRLLEHDIIIFQFPLYWYSTPSILKEWQDLVLEYGFAYGEQGQALKNKYFMCVISAGSKENAYQADGMNRSSIRDLLLPLAQMANLTGMVYLAPFTLFGARTAVEENKIGLHISAYHSLLMGLIHEQIDLRQLTQVDHLTAANLSLVVNTEQE